jgi:16S rRNA (guanine527-N7)-methyltransferase
MAGGQRHPEMTAGTEYRELLAPHVSGEDLRRLVRYAELLERWSARHSLVRFGSRRELVERHLVDALVAVPFMPPAGRLLDVGSGAGLPGVPLLAVCAGLTGTLLEPRQKRWAFLRLVIRELGLDAGAERARFEALEPGRSWDRITARAVGGDADLLAWARDRLEPDGEVVLWTTSEGEARLRSSSGWRVLSSAIPGLDRGRLCRLQPCFT